MSAPAAKAFWEPVRRIVRIEWDWSKERSAWFNSVMRGVERALRALGRLSVTLGKLVMVGSRGEGEIGYFVQLLGVALMSR